MGFVLSSRDLDRLVPVHPDLVAVVKVAAKVSPIEFAVVQGLRTPQTEAAMVKGGKSLTLDSLHLAHRYAGVPHLCCTAVDLGIIEGGKIDWAFPDYARLNAVMQQASLAVGKHVEWGGIWKHLKDGDHWQLPRTLYPVEA